MKRYKEPSDLYRDLLFARNDFNAITDARGALLEAAFQLETMYDEELSEGIVKESLDAIVGILKREIEVKRNRLRTFEKLYYGR